MVGSAGSPAVPPGTEGEIFPWHLRRVGFPLRTFRGGWTCSHPLGMGAGMSPGPSHGVSRPLLPSLLPNGACDRAGRILLPTSRPSIPLCFPQPWEWARGSDKPPKILLGDVLGSWEALQVPGANGGCSPSSLGWGTCSTLGAGLELAEILVLIPAPLVPSPRVHPSSHCGVLSRQPGIGNNRED